jgi:hypothetical protein
MNNDDASIPIVGRELRRGPGISTEWDGYMHKWNERDEMDEMNEIKPNEMNRDTYMYISRAIWPDQESRRVRIYLPSCFHFVHCTLTVPVSVLLSLYVQYSSSAPLYIPLSFNIANPGNVTSR